MYRRWVKRSLDFVLSVLLLIAVTPLLFAIVFLVRMRLGRPIFFSQERVGKDQNPFLLYKFRTMTEEKDETGRYLPEEKRLTRWGRVLRSTSLDELPELINIIRGDMSIIGPRPMPTRYLPFMTDEEKRRHTVRGGLIPPEIQYENVTPTWKEQFSYEVRYAGHVTFQTDLTIFFSVFRMLLKRHKENYGAYLRLPLDQERSAAASGAALQKEET